MNIKTACLELIGNIQAFSLTHEGRLLNFTVGYSVK